MTSLNNKPPELITSIQNPKYKLWKTLLDSKGIKKEKLAILSGEKLVLEYIKSKSEVTCELVQEHKTPVTKSQTFILPQDLFKELDINGTHHSLLIIPAKDFSESRFGSPKDIEVIAPLQDPRNLGALIRSCAAFGVKKIHLPQSACNPYHPKCLKVAANGFLYVEFLKSPSIAALVSENAEQLKNKTFLLDSRGIPLSEVKGKNNIYLVVGEEGQGLPENLKNLFQTISIPIQNVESLNATVAISIALYELSK